MDSVERVERDHVHSVYSQIALHFSDTRYKPWPRVEEFIKSQPPGSFIADVGCGNGKYLGLNPLAYKLGSDICPELVSIARQRGHEVAVCDCLHLPYKTGVFDAVICIAMVHHLSTEERRLAALRELSRVLRPGGTLLVYVWAMEQESRKFDRQDVLVPWHLQTKYSAGANLNVTSQAKTVPRKPMRRCGAEEGSEAAPTPRHATNEPTRVPQLLESSCPDGVRPCIEKQAQLGRSEELSPRHNGNGSDLREVGHQTFLRYYHVFQRGELSELFVRGVDDLIVKEEVFDHDNWCVTAQKVLKK
ncbi:hypothetical protein EMCRGX_G033918 [Ephydatia muelleri]